MVLSKETPDNVATKNNSTNTTTPSPQSPRMGVVVPLANEEKTVEGLLQRILKQLSPNDKVYCIIDNASRDNTLQKVQQIAQTDPRVVAVWAPENRCVVDAYVRGYREAISANCQWILEMDGGLSHCPEEIPLFISAMQQGIDFAAGSRFIKGGSHIGSFSRRFVSKAGTVLANLMLKTRMHDMTSGFECFTHKALSYVLEQGINSKAHFFQTEIRYMLRDWNWQEIPINYTNPSKSLGKSPITDAFKNLWRLYRSRKHQNKTNQYQN